MANRRLEENLRQRRRIAQAADKAEAKGKAKKGG
jgi:hypothetical protein|tara:strand:+ start:63 stop:164 length:102 start_codon:yes stop_codon:yes gene_type:complete